MISIIIASAQQQIPIIETNMEKGVKLNINAGFHFSNMIGKNVQKDDNLFKIEQRFN